MHPLIIFAMNILACSRGEAGPGRAAQAAHGRCTHPHILIAKCQPQPVNRLRIFGRTKNFRGSPTDFDILIRQSQLNGQQVFAGGGTSQSLQSGTSYRSVGILKRHRQSAGNPVPVKTAEDSNRSATSGGIAINQQRLKNAEDLNGISAPQNAQRASRRLTYVRIVTPQAISKQDQLRSAAKATQCMGSHLLKGKVSTSKRTP